MNAKRFSIQQNGSSVDNSFLKVTPPANNPFKNYNPGFSGQNYMRRKKSSIDMPKNEDDKATIIHVEVDEESKYYDSPLQPTPMKKDQIICFSNPRSIQEQMTDPQNDNYMVSCFQPQPKTSVQPLQQVGAKKKEQRAVSQDSQDGEFQDCKADASFGNQGHSLSQKKSVTSALKSSFDQERSLSRASSKSVRFHENQ